MNGDTKTESYLRVAAEGTRADLPSDTCCNTKTQNLILGVANRIMDVEDEVEELKNNPDVVDIVDTYADLQAYDTQHLTENDIIRVLQDETHDNNSTYYRFTKNPDTWTFIGEISGGGSSVNVVQTTGTSTTDVMSQNATTKMVFADPSTMQLVQIGKNANAGSYASNSGRIAIGNGATSTGFRNNIAIGNGVSVTPTQYSSIGIGSGTTHNSTVNIGGTSYAQDGDRNILIGTGATVNAHYRENCVCIGYGATASRSGEMNIGSGTSTYGYNNTSNRVLGGVYDGQLSNDAATVGQVNATIDAINAALSTSIPHIGA